MICTEKKKVKVHMSKRPKWTELIPVSLAWSMPRSIATPLWDGMQVQRKVTPNIILLVPIYTNGWRDLLSYH